MQNSITTPPPICNIALIGQSNYLKSVALNALPNYLKNITPTDVNEWINLVPVNVNFFDRRKCTNVPIPFGEDIVEPENCHLLLHQTRVFRLIDLSEEELQHCDIYKHCDTLHGILYLITSEQLGDFFEDTFKPLLAELEAFTNVIFCFTYNYQPSYDAPALKKKLNNDLAPFNIQLREGQNCFHIDCEPFVLLMAHKSHHYNKLTAQNREYWIKSHETACEIFYQIARGNPYNLSHNLIASDSKLFFNATEKAVKNIENLIKLKEQEMETETKRLTAFNSKNRNLNYYRSLLDEIKAIPGQITDYLDEIKNLELETLEFIKFILLKLNNRESVKKLVTPFVLKFLTNNSFYIIRNNETQQQQQIKSEHDETTQNENVQNVLHFIDSVVLNRESTVTDEQMFNTLIELASSKTSGEYFNIHLAYFEAKQITNPLLNSILELAEPIVKILKNVQAANIFFQKLIHQIGKSENKIRLTCSNHFLYQDGEAAFSCFEECGCKVSDVVLNVKGHPSVKKCKTINSRSKCKICKCTFKEHVHQKSKDLKNFALKALNDISIFQSVAVKFDYLLLKYSQKSLNDYIDQYWNVEPAEENAESLNKFKEDYRENLLQKLWPNKKVDLTGVPQLCTHLFQLKCNGEYFKNYKANLENVNALEVEQDDSTSSTSQE